MHRMPLVWLRRWFGVTIEAAMVLAVLNQGKDGYSGAYGYENSRT